MFLILFLLRLQRRRRVFIKMHDFIMTSLWSRNAESELPQWIALLDSLID